MEYDLRNVFPFWDQLTEDQMALLARNTRRRDFSRGEMVRGGGSDCAGVLYVESGELRAYTASEDGREVTLYRMQPGEVCVLSAGCVMDAVAFDMYADAVKDTTLLVTAPAAFARVREENIHCEAYAYRLATERFSDVMWTLQQVLFMSFGRRLAAFLVDESVKSGGDTVPLTQETIARYLSAARETVTRMLRYFQKEGLVTLSRSCVTIEDKAGLRKMALDG